MVRRGVGFVPLLLAAVLCGPAPAQTIYTYVGQLGANSALIAWGITQAPGNRNTIGRDSIPLGPAQVRIGGKTIAADRNWVDVRGLQPNTSYPYEVDVNGRRAGGGVLRTWPAQATRLTFFVIGDYGDAGAGQRAIASLMATELRRRSQTDNPPRFVLTMGDNIYADVNLGYVIRGSGSQDRDWEAKFFAPYREVLQQIPFLPSIGNHDGNSSENRGDLAVYLDNFFFPGNRPARWYEFDFGGLADFFSLDTTSNSTTGHPAPMYGPEGEQSRWLERAMAESKAPWKIPYFHHPPFNAGPGHGASYSVLGHWLSLFQKSGVKVVFSGHEHNYQFSDLSDATGHVRYIVSGAGGELRAGDVRPNMARSHIEGWAPFRHFLVVEIDGGAMRITPISNETFVVRDANGRELPAGLTVDLGAATR